MRAPRHLSLALVATKRCSKAMTPYMDRLLQTDRSFVLNRTLSFFEKSGYMCGIIKTVNQTVTPLKQERGHNNNE